MSHSSCMQICIYVQLLISRNKARKDSLYPSCYLMSYSHQQTVFIFFKTWFNEIKIRSVLMKQAFKSIGHNYFPSVGGRAQQFSYITVLHLKQHCKGAAQAKELSFTRCFRVSAKNGSFHWTKAKTHGHAYVFLNKNRPPHSLSDFPGLKLGVRQSKKSLLAG